MKRSIKGAGKKVLASALSAAMVVAFAPAVAMAEGEVVSTQISITQYNNTLADALAAVTKDAPLLSDGITNEIWPSKTPVYYDSTNVGVEKVFYESLEEAITQANADNADETAKIYIRPGASGKFGLSDHTLLKTSIEIYGNNASLDFGWEPCVEHTDTATYTTMTKDFTVSIYNLHDGAGVWGIRNKDSNHVLTVNMENCNNVHELMINEGAGSENSVVNYNIKNCTFDGNSCASTCPVTTTNPGVINVEDCTFTNLNSDYPFNINNKNGGTTTVNAKNLTFNNCGKEGKEALRLASENGSVVAVVDGAVFNTSIGSDMVVGKSSGNKGAVCCTYKNTSGSVTIYKIDTEGAASKTLTGETTVLSNTDVVAMVGDRAYPTFEAAKNAALASDNSVIDIVKAGTYTTNFKVPDGKSLTIQSAAELKDVVVLDGQIFATGNLALKNLAYNVSNIVDQTGISQTGSSAIALWNDAEATCENVTFDMSGADGTTAVCAWWSTGDGANITVKNCTFNCNGQRPIRSDASVTAEGCTFNDPYRYAIQMTSKADTITAAGNAVVNFKNNTINNGEHGKAFVYGVQLEGSDYGCSNLTINGSGNTINAGEWDTENESAMYYCECGEKIPYETIVWNTEVPAVHADASHVPPAPIDPSTPVTPSDPTAPVQPANPDQDAVDSVIAKIDAIGTVTADSKDAIDEARAAYDALTDEQRALVSPEKLAALTAAEAVFAEITAPEPEAPAEHAPAVTTRVVKGVTYTVSGSTVKATKIAKAAKSATILDTVKIGGKTYKVTAIPAKAYKGCTKLAKLTVGANIKSVGSSAFSGCTKLKTITVKSKSLTKAKVKGSLKGSSVTTVKVKVSTKKATNQKYAKAYAKIFTKANCGKKVKVKAL